MIDAFMTFAISTAGITTGAVLGVIVAVFCIWNFSDWFQNFRTDGESFLSSVLMIAVGGFLGGMLWWAVLMMLVIGFVLWVVWLVVRKS